MDMKCIMHSNVAGVFKQCVHLLTALLEMLFSNATSNYSAVILV